LCWRNSKRSGKTNSLSISRNRRITNKKQKRKRKSLGIWLLLKKKRFLNLLTSQRFKNTKSGFWPKRQNSINSKRQKLKTRLRK
jgi:hypothetical protein